MSALDPDRDLVAEADRADASQVASALERFGCFVLRRALPLVVLERILARALESYRALDAAHADQTLPNEVERRSYGYGILRPFEEDLTCDDGRPMRESMQELVRKGPLAAVVRAYLGPRVTLLLEACHVRRQGPGQLGRPVPPHQDATVMRMRAGRLLNFWVPLVDGAGRDAPGLAFYPKSLASHVACEPRGALASARERMYSRFEIAEPDLRAAVGDLPLWTPVLDRGDVLCLDGWSIHRTAFDPRMTRQRYDFEIRFCRSADVCPGMPGELRPVELDEWVA